jgi:3-oxoacyl-(acyl-carrier-protein) synthase
MRAGLRDAGADIDDVDYINAHGTSTPMNDKSESAAIHAVFGAKTARVSVSSTKSSMGHLIAAAGAVEAVACALAIRYGEMPVNANLVDRDPECDLNLVVGKPQRRRLRVTLSNSFGFGGSNSCVVLRNPEEVDGAGAVRA